jgi:ferredoxin-NADP reductase
MINWHVGTLVESKQASEHVKSLTFEVPGWPGHLAGQHCDILLVAKNGYRAERSYSIASAPGSGTKVEFGVALLPDGEVSPYLWQLKVGQQINLRGPIGRHFIWEPTFPGPLVLIGGGSGLVPLVAMLRHYVNHRGESPHEVVLVESGRTEARLLYRDELDSYAQKFHEIKLSRLITGNEGRITADFIDRALVGIDKAAANVYVCGGTSFVELVANTLLQLHIPREKIKTERFG